MMIIPIGTAVARPAHTTVMIGLAVTATKMTGTAGVGGTRETAAAGARAMITTTPVGEAGARMNAGTGARAMITTAPGGAVGTRETAAAGAIAMITITPVSAAGAVFQIEVRRARGSLIEEKQAATQQLVYDVA